MAETNHTYSIPTNTYAGVRYTKLDWQAVLDDDGISYKIDWTLYVIGRTSDVGWWDLREAAVTVNAAKGTITSISHPKMSAQYGGGPYGEVDEGKGDGTYGTYARFVDEYVNSSSRGNYLYKLPYKANWSRKWGVGQYLASDPYQQSMPMCSGTFTIKSDSKGETNFTINLKFNVIDRIIEGGSTYELPVTMTHVKAPSNLRVNQSIVIPGKNFTLSWDPGSKGINNEVSGYKIEYSINSGGWTLKGTVEASTNSLVFTAVSSRGTTYAFRVQTIGKNGMDSDYATSKVLCTTNNLPDAPKIVTSPSSFSGNPITIALAAGNTNNSDQKSNLYYSINDSSEIKGPISTSFNVPVQDFSNTYENTYYFWTHDGLEFSDSKASQKITYSPSNPTLSCSGDNHSTNTPKPDGTPSGAIYRPVVTLNISGESKGSSSFGTPTYYVSVNGNSWTKTTSPYTGAAGSFFRFKAEASDGIRVRSVESDYYYIPALPNVNIIPLKNDASTEKKGDYFDKYFKVEGTYDTYFKISNITLGGITCTDGIYTSNTDGQVWSGAAPAGVNATNFSINFSNGGSKTLYKTRVSDYNISTQTALSATSVDMYDKDAANAVKVIFNNYSDNSGAFYRLDMASVKVAFNSQLTSTSRADGVYTLINLHTDCWEKYKTYTKFEDLKITITIQNEFERTFSTDKTLKVTLNNSPQNKGIKEIISTKEILYSKS